MRRGLHGSSGLLPEHQLKQTPRGRSPWAGSVTNVPSTTLSASHNHHQRIQIGVDINVLTCFWIFYLLDYIQIFRQRRIDRHPRPGLLVGLEEAPDPDTAS